jgi:hypothetical protein
VIALVILVFVEAQDAGSPLSGALARAAEEGLGPGAAVSIRTIDRGVPDRALLDAGRAESATAVARISWLNERRLEARVEVITTATGASAAQTLTFDASDPVEERGRALGLVLAAMLDPEAAARRDPAAARRDASATEVRMPAPAVVSAPPAEPVAPARRWALDAAAEGGVALGGAGSGVGGAIGLRWLPTRRLGGRVGVRARFGEVGEAQAASLALSIAAGGVLSIIEAAEGRRFGLAMRLDALLLYESLSHLSADDPEPVRRGRLLPGAALLAEAHWSLSPTLALLLAAGPEVAFGRTRVLVRQAEVAELAPIRVAVQGGLVARF